MYTPSRILIMGATGMVGRELLRIIEERHFPHHELVPVASPASAGTTLPFAGGTVTVIASDPALFQPGDLVFFTGHDDLAAELVPQAVKASAVVIDNSATFRQDPTVPLIVPEVNPHALAGHQGLIANPNCTTATFIVPLHAIWREYGLAFTSVASYQAISGAGTGPYTQFQTDLAALVTDGTSSAEALPGNVLAQIGGLDAEGQTSEERKMQAESRKMLGDPTLDIVGTAVRVPTLVGHGCAVHCKTLRPVPDVAELTRVIGAQAGVALTPLPTPIAAAGTDPVWVGRIRWFDAHTIGFWCVADNLRKGAALNAVQIGELWLASMLP